MNNIDVDYLNKIDVNSNKVDFDSNKVDDDESNIDFHTKFEPSTHVPYVKPGSPDEHVWMPDSTVQQSGFVKNSK